MQTEQQSLRAAAGQRFWQIDALRGLALLNMLVYHAMYDWVYIFGHASGWYDIWSTHCHVWQQYICWSFILLSGYSFTLSRRPLKNGLLTAACAVVLTGLVVVLLMGYVRLTEVSADISQIKTEMGQLEERHVALLTQYEKTFDLATVKRVAEEAGMTKPTAGQVEYLELPAADSTVVYRSDAGTALENIAESISRALGSVVEYFR